MTKISDTSGQDKVLATPKRQSWRWGLAAIATAAVLIILTPVVTQWSQAEGVITCHVDAGDPVEQGQLL